MNIQSRKWQIIVVLILFIIPCKSLLSQNGQVIKYKAVHLAIAPVEGGKIKLPFSKEEDISALVVMNFNKDKIDIYSPKEQHFDIVGYLPTDKSDNKFTNYSFDTVDQDGDKCSIFLIVAKNTANYYQLWVRYNTAVFVYNIVLQGSP